MHREDELMHMLLFKTHERFVMTSAEFPDFVELDPLFADDSNMLLLAFESSLDAETLTEAAVYEAFDVALARVGYWRDKLGTIWPKPTALTNPSPGSSPTA